MKIKKTSKARRDQKNNKLDSFIIIKEEGYRLYKIDIPKENKNYFSGCNEY